MKLLVVPVPLFDVEMSVDFYWFSFQKGENPLLSGQNYSILDGAMDSPLFDVLNKVGLEALTAGKPIFVPIPHIALLAFPEQKINENPENIIFVLDKNITIDKSYIDSINRLKNLGFKFACDKRMDLTYHLPIIELCDYIFVSIRIGDIRNVRMYLKSRNKNITIIVCDIDTPQLFSIVRYDDFKLFEGSFYRIPLLKNQAVVSPLKINNIQLLNIVRDENFDIEKVAQIVQQDTALAISLLKMVNSLGLAQKIKSINHAAALLGQNELRKWITTAVTKMLSADKPNEITKLSLMRAKFAENIAPKFSMAISAQSLFLMGLFSTLDIILDIPMETALSVVQVSDRIKEALLNHSGDYYNVLEFILSYETADWVGVSRSMIMFSLDSQDIYSAYIDALVWYSGLISMTDESLE